MLMPQLLYHLFKLQLFFHTLQQSHAIFVCCSAVMCKLFKVAIKNVILTLSLAISLILVRFADASVVTLSNQPPILLCTSQLSFTIFACCSQVFSFYLISNPVPSLENMSIPPFKCWLLYNLITFSIVI